MKPKLLLKGANNYIIDNKMVIMSNFFFFKVGSLFPSISGHIASVAVLPPLDLVAFGTALRPLTKHKDRLNRKCYDEKLSFLVLFNIVVYKREKKKIFC